MLEHQAAVNHSGTLLHIQELAASSECLPISLRWLRVFTYQAAARLLS